MCVLITFFISAFSIFHGSDILGCINAYKMTWYLVDERCLCVLISTLSYGDRNLIIKFEPVHEISNSLTS